MKTQQKNTDIYAFKKVGDKKNSKNNLKTEVNIIILIARNHCIFDACY